MKLAPYLILIFAFGCSKQLSPEEQKAFENNYKKTQQGVSDWIKKNALYPDSYEPISFEAYAQSVSKDRNGPIPNSENYFIKHTHKILDKDSILTTFSGYFILEYDFDVNIIEVERSNATGKAFPPQTQIWMQKFGRPLTAADSLDLEKKQQEVNRKFLRELKKGLENGDMYIEDPEDEIEMERLLDTIDLKK